MPLDYNETVELWTLDEDTGRGVADHPLIERMPLWRAVRMVIVDWKSGSRRQRRAQIIRAGGASLMDLGGIQAVYDQDDFPARRDRSWKGDAAA